MMQRFRSKPTVITSLNAKVIENKKVAAANKSKDQSFTDWTYIGDPGAPAFQNAAVNTDPTEVTYGKVAFIKNSSGWIQLTGQMTATATTTAFTLPQGFRPRKKLAFAVANNVGSLTIVTIDPLGNVVGASGTGYHLDNISFRAEL